MGKTIGVNFYSLTIPLYALMAEAMKDEAAKRGINLVVTSGDFTPATQTSQLASLVTQGVDLILATPVSGQALIPGYKDVQAAGIPIISFANKVPNENEDAFVGEAWKDAGIRLVQVAADATGGKGEVLVVHGPKGADYEVEMAAGIVDELKKYPNMKIVSEVYNNDLSIAGALNLVSSALTANPGVNVVLADDDSSALGAIQAINGAGLSRADFFVAGFGGYPDAIAAMKAGKGPDFTISLKPDTWGRLAIATAGDWLAGKKPDGHSVTSPQQEVTPENVNQLTDDDLN